MSISKAIRDLIEARGLRPVEVADRLEGTRNRATFYRLVSGNTNDPRASTLVGVCNALAISPNELLQLAGRLPFRERSPNLLDVELRQAFGEVQNLNDDDRRLCLTILRGLIDMRAGRREVRPRGTRGRRRASG